MATATAAAVRRAQMLENIREMGALPGRAACAAMPACVNSSENLEAKSGEQSAHLERRALLRTASRHLHLSEPQQARQSQERIPAPRCRVPGHAGQPGRCRATPIPQAELHRAWELVCLNQFHDIIPGSSIAPVYTESLAQYAEVAALGEAVRDDDALAAIAARLRGDLVVANPIVLCPARPGLLARRGWTRARVW